MEWFLRYSRCLWVVCFLAITPVILFGATRSRRFEPEIVVHNRVLAKVNNRMLSVLDVVKKLDLVFYRDFPQYRDSIQARFQFYQLHWQNVLDEMIDGELILVNAEEMKLVVSDGDVRQQMEEKLGPDVVASIAQMGLTYDEVFTMIRKEIIIERMTQNMAYSQAIARVGPQEIRSAYELYAKENPIEESWNYRVLTIKSSQALEACSVANEAAQLVEKKMPIEGVFKQLELKQRLYPTLSVTLSEEYLRTAKTFSKVHRDVVLGLKEGECSKPLLQNQKDKTSTTYRLFVLLKYTSGGTIPFSQVEVMLRNRLLDQAIGDEVVAYRSRLRQRFKMDKNYLQQMMPENFTPFELVGT